MESTLRPGEISIDDALLERWQAVVDLLAKIADVPAALIMRVEPEEIEVFRASHTADNPYRVGERAPFNRECRLYCETVIRTGERLLVPNALKDSAWDDNPDIALDMISYLGLPLRWPDGEPFGTVCILDSKENAYSELIESSLAQFRELVEMHLALLVRNAELSRALDEIETLRGMLPICSHCKSIRNERGYWQRIEEYLGEHSRATLSHGICEACLKKHYPSFGESE